VLVNTLLNLKDKQKYLEDQEAQYHSYISDSMAAMQKKGGNKKRFIMPFTPQWHHLRTLEKQGRKPKFGSYKYSVSHPPAIYCMMMMPLSRIGFDDV
jgi:Ras GTPase-activating-like protein IQGAP2/3